MRGLLEVEAKGLALKHNTVFGFAVSEVGHRFVHLIECKFFNDGLHVVLIREVEHELQRPIGILADLQGPKLRVGTFSGDSAMLEEGAASELL